MHPLSCQLPEIIEQIVKRQIIEDAAVEAGIKVEDEELQQAADQFRLMNQLDTAKDTHQWLETHQLSVNDFEKIVEFGVISGKLMQHLFADKVEPYFYANQLNYASTVIYEIVLDDPDLAMELFYSIQEKEVTFYEVARQYITDVELQRKSGYLGKVTRQDLRPEVSAAVFAAKPPQLLKPVMTAKGVHVIFVEEIIKPELEAMLRLEILSEFLDDWLTQKREQVEIITKLTS
ncbi:MAG: peptidylprolyl isomerase [Lyngbya sp.]|nr:peptidylprolyl isomerase [Lyngbya sp.]